MAKDLRLDVVTSSDGKGLVSAAVEVDHLADKTDKLGRKFDETAVEGAFLAKELEAVKLKSAELARQFNETGDKALLKQISANQRYEAQLSRVGKELDKVGHSAEGEAQKLGKNLAKDTENGFSKWLSGGGFGDGLASSLLSPQGLAVAVGAASVLGVMAGGAILAGIGTVGIGAGIAAEFKSPAVAAAFQGLKEELLAATFKDAAQPMIAPTAAAFRDLASMVKTDLAPGLKSMFTELAPEIGGLVHGFGKFVTEVATGFEKAAVASKPLLALLGNELLPGLGKDVAALFATIAHNAPEAEQGLKLLFITIEAGIGTVNVLINVFSKLFDMFVGQFEAGIFVLDKFAGAMLAVDKALHLPHDDVDAAKKSLDGFLGSVDDFRTGAHDPTATFNAASTAAGGLAGSLDITTAATKALTDAWAAFDGALSEDQAISHGKDLIAGLSGQLDKHNKSLSRNSAASRANREAVVGDIQQERDSLAGLVSSGQITQKQADKMYAAWIKDFDKAAAKAGISQAAIEDLNKAFGLLPKSKTIDIHVNYTTSGMAYPKPTHAKHHAKGGPFASGELMLVGEEGPELLQFDRGGSVIPNNALSSAMPGSGSGGGGGGGSTLIGFDTNGDALVQAILAALRPVIRKQYRGNVTLALAGAR